MQKALHTWKKNSLGWRKCSQHALIYSGVHEKPLVYISSYEVVSVFYIVPLALRSFCNFLSFPSCAAPTLLLTPDDRLTLTGSLMSWPTITERVWSVYVCASGRMAPLEHLESIAHKGSPHKLIYCILLYVVLWDDW